VRLRELLVLAGGLIDTASGDVTIFRQKDLNCRRTAANTAEGAPSPAAIAPQDNGSESLTIKLSDLLSGRPEADPEILSGDLITVNRAMPIYLIGAINRPGPVYSLAPLTVTRAIASAGGAAKDADETKIAIYRRDGGETRSIEVDLAKIKRGEIEDEVLRHFDILEVSTKGSGKRKYPPAVVSNENSDRAASDGPLRVVD
jgi:protein involved in polysaccharide export with SLBB domain